LVAIVLFNLMISNRKHIKLDNSYLVKKVGKILFSNEENCYTESMSAGQCIFRPTIFFKEVVPGHGEQAHKQWEA